MNRHAVRLIRKYIDRLAIGDTITIHELVQYVNTNSRCLSATTGEVAQFLRHQELERIAPGVWRKVIRCQ